MIPEIGIIPTVLLYSSVFLRACISDGLKFYMVGFSVLCGADSLGIAEALGKIAGRGKTQNSGDLGQGQVCFSKKAFAFPDPAGDHIIDGRNTVFPFEGMGHVIFIDADFLGELIQCDVFFIVLIDIVPH